MNQQTEPLAPFGAADQSVIDSVMRAGIETQDGWGDIELAARHTHANHNRAADIAADLLRDEKVAAATRDTTNPAADQAQLTGTPGIITDTRWQMRVFGPNGDPGMRFDETPHIISDRDGDSWSALDAAPGVRNRCPNHPDGHARPDPVTPLWPGVTGPPPPMPKIS